jgi:hypothetical protein
MLSSACSSSLNRPGQRNAEKDLLFVACLRARLGNRFRIKVRFPEPRAMKARYLPELPLTLIVKVLLALAPVVLSVTVRTTLFHVPALVGVPLSALLTTEMPGGSPVADQM